MASFAAHDFYAIVRKGDQKLLEEINYGIQQMDLHEGDWRNVLHYKYYASTLPVPVSRWTAAMALPLAAA